jgi:hypothetical protein
MKMLKWGIKKKFWAELIKPMSLLNRLPVLVNLHHYCLTINVLHTVLLFRNNPLLQAEILSRLSLLDIYLKFCTITMLVTV